MRVVVGKLVTRRISGWPVELIRADIPIGHEFTVDLDSVNFSELYNVYHPEWGKRKLASIVETVNNHRIPVECLVFRDPVTRDELEVKIRKVS